jgi:hypothetical protein
MAWGFMPVELWKTLTEKEKEIFILDTTREGTDVHVSNDVSETDVKESFSIRLLAPGTYMFFQFFRNKRNAYTYASIDTAKEVVIEPSKSWDSIKLVAFNLAPQIELILEHDENIDNFDHFLVKFRDEREEHPTGSYVYTRGIDRLAPTKTRVLLSLKQTEMNPEFIFLLGAFMRGTENYVIKKLEVPKEEKEEKAEEGAAE